MDTDILESELTAVPKKLKQNKAYSDTIGGLHVVAVDGTEHFRSANIHCDECLEYKIETKEGTVTHYVHRVVIAQKVGTKMQPILAAEKINHKDTIQKDDQTAGHEGELTSAKRLVSKVISLYGPRFVDVFTMDALYMNYPFTSLVTEYDKDIIAKVTNERTILYKEREAISTLVKPITGYDKKEAISYEIYEIPDMHLVLDWDIPIRGFNIISKKSESVNENLFLCATTLPKWKASANTVRKIVHYYGGLRTMELKT